MLAAYSQATSDEVLQDISIRRQRSHVTDAILLALGFNPFLGRRREDHWGIFEHLNLNLPANLFITGGP